MTLTITVDGVDITDKVRLESVKVELQAIQGLVGVGKLDLDDTTGIANLLPAAKEWSVTESDATPSTIAGGFVAERKVDRGPLVAGVQRQFDPVLEDWNTVFTDRVLKGRRAKRPAETDVQRVRWLLGTNTLGMLAGAGHVPNTGTVDMPAANYRGKTPLAVLDDCAEDSGKNFYAYYKAGDWVLFYDKDSTDAAFTSTLKVSDVPSDIDDSSVFGAADIEYELDPERIYSGIFVKYKGGRLYRSLAATETTFRRLQKTVFKRNIKTSKRARKWADRQLAKLNEETKRLSLTLAVPGSALGQLQAGMRIQVKLRSRGVTAYTYFRISGMSTSFRQGRGGVSDAMYDVRLEMRDKVRPVNLDDDFGGGDSSGDLGGATGSTDDVGGSGDSGPYTVDRFSDRTVTPASLTDGDATTPASIAGGASQGVYFSIGPWVLNPDQDESPIERPFGFSAAQRGGVVSDHASAQSWTSRPSWTACPGLQYTFTGYSEREQWYKLTVPAHPGSAAGIAVDVGVVDASQCKGYGKVGPVEVVVASAQPEAMGTGSVVATLTAGQSSTIVIPIGLVPAEGGSLWIGYRPGWEVTSKAVLYRYTCGWPSYAGFQSYQTDSAGVPYGGYAGSASVVAPTNAKWQVLSSGSTDYGATSASADAPFGGPHTWHAAVEDGAPTAGIDVDGLYVESTASASQSFTLLGADEDDTADDGPWSNVGGWRADIEWDMDALGLTGQAGTRVLEIVSMAEDRSTVARIHLGDGDRAMGVSADGGMGEQYKAKTFTADTRYVAAMDIRSGTLRAKVWEKSGRVSEPAAWDVQVPMSGIDASSDRFTLRLRVGNIISSQRVTIRDFTAYAAASPGDIIAGEMVGLADGSGRVFPTAHRYAPHSVVATVNGINAKPQTEAPQEAGYSLDFMPTAGSIVRARYVVADIAD